MVALADGAGNSRGGASAAEALIRAVDLAAPFFRSGLKQWDLQALLFTVDEALALGGEETTGRSVPGGRSPYRGGRWLYLL